jgi:sucrose-6F-phosphate phosphohydrolase
MTDRWLFVSDVDDTLLGDDAALARLMAALRAAPHVTTAYNSSRPCASLRRSLTAVPQLDPPDYLIGGLGTEIEHGHTAEPLPGYTGFLGQNWDRPRIAALLQDIGLPPHAAEYQTPLKASYDVPNSATVDRVRRRLGEAGLAAKIIYSGGKNLDLIPRPAGKGGVIAFLRQQLNIPPQRVVVAGDSGNDVEMFIAPYRGIIVGNADADLKRLNGEHIYQASARCAAGVLEGLNHWRVV